ncbi:NACHT domain-containing protein [Streptomyces sp. NPDC003273]|uniref:NACHT domain-containing protein n=1 Tax=Streptomyces sp. NPDC003273 TaxID=3364678 RepID=UPI003691E564
MKFDLYRLGPREFENLVQTIAVAELGPDVAVYGAGSDGGREATQNESGDSDYIVLQAKYKEVASSPQSEATWLIAELRKEFKEWRESDKRSKTPDRFIVATNVTLSATPRTGGMDRVAKVMREECEKLDIQDWVVWHSENVNRFLEKHPGIRTSYAAWILPGDILTVLYDDVAKRSTDTARAIRGYVAKELLNDRYANLDQAGSADDRTVSLAEVFFDVPISHSPERNQESGARCLDTLIAACDAKHSMTAGAQPPDEALLRFNHIVLVGGPGQGKSTVSQFLCQLYRAQLVKESTAMRNAEVRSAVTQINTQAEREGLLPKARRWPIKIPLTRLADELAQGKCTTLLDYIAQRVTEKAGLMVTANDMRGWLGEFPWLLVLDGLDEVPGTSNRSQVLAQISAFQLEADELNADLVVVASTRPQGYTDEFSPKHYVHLYLTALGTQSALAYGRKLADARHGNSTERVSRLMERLERAADEPSTAHLMASPLQVTIMAVLLDRVGKAPKDRFTLFADYYRVIFERELEKEGAASNLLRDHKTDIDSIHADVGLLLQTRSERSGETESSITVEELDRIIGDRLAGEGHSGAELASLASAISKAATHRLVFLVPSRDGEVSFEIRSLQEFWAADALMNCSEDEISHRLRMLAVSSHWRNVLLFALGNIFAMRRNSLRDSVITLVSELNSHSETFGNLPRRILTGSRLAAEILYDGMVRAPRYEAILVEESLKLLSLPYSEHVSLVASCLSERGVEIAHDHVAATGQLAWNESLLVFLAVRAAHGDTWSYQRLEAIYNQATGAERADFFHTAITHEVPVLLHVAARCLADPDMTMRLAPQAKMLKSSHYAPLTAPKGCSSAPMWLPALVELLKGDQYRIRDRILLRMGVVRGGVVSVTADILPLAEALDSGFPPDHWLVSVGDFCRSPGKETLANVVRAMGQYSTGYESIADALPWIVHYAIQMYLAVGDPAIELIARGHLGDVDDWLMLEDNWRQASDWDIETDDFEVWRAQRRTFLPLPACRLTIVVRGASGGLTAAKGVLRLCEGIRSEESRAEVADVFLRSMLSQRRDNLTAQVIERLHRIAKRKHRFVTFSWLGDTLSDEWIDTANRIAADVSIGRGWVPYSSSIDLLGAWLTDLTRTGLGRLVAARGLSRSWPERSTAKLVQAWEAIRSDLDPTDEIAQIVCVATCLMAPPKDEGDVHARMACLMEAIAADVVVLAYVAGGLELDHDEPSRSFILGLVDHSAVRETDRQVLFERMVRLQSSVVSGIEYERMRPC